VKRTSFVHVLVAFSLSALAVSEPASTAGLFEVRSAPVYVPGQGGAEAFDGKIIAGPSVIKVPKAGASGQFAYMMYYDGRHPDGPVSIGLATSDDGISWTRHDVNPVLSDARDPAALYDPDEPAAPYKMWYCFKADGGKGEIRYATSTDGINWTKVGTAISPGNAGELDDFDVGDPCVLKQGSEYLMYYAAESNAFEGAVPSPQSIHLAVSSNGRDWTKVGAVLDGALYPVPSSPQGAVTERVLQPAVIVFEREQVREFWMFFESGSGEPRTIHLARSLDGRRWAKYSGNPVLSGTAAKGSFPFSVSGPSPLVDASGQVIKMWFHSQQEDPHGIGLASCSVGALAGVTQQEIDQAPTELNLHALSFMAEAGNKAKQGLWQEAVSAYQLAIAAVPKSMYARKAWLQLGDIWRNKVKDSQKAAQAYQAIIQNWPTHPDAAVAHDSLARVYLIEMKDPQKAVSEFVKVYLQWPDAPIAKASQTALGQVYKSPLHDYPKALAAFQVVVDKWPDDPLAAQALLGMGVCYGQMGQYDKAIETLRLLMAKFPQDPHLPAAELWIAHNFLWLKQFERALSGYAELVGERGGGIAAEARYYMGYCQMMLKDYDHAIETLNKVVASDPEPKRVVRAHYYLASCHYAKKSFDLAVAELDKILADATPPYAEWHPAALFLKADSYHQAGRNDDARAAIDLLLSKFPDSSQVPAARTLLEAIGAAPSR